MLPQAVKLVLWSYNTDKIDEVNDRQLIVSQILNFGSKDASDWALKKYGHEEMRKVALKMPRSSWNKKSLAYWSLILDFESQTIKNRFE